LHKYVEEFYATIPPKLANGDMKYLEDVRKGLDQAGEALLDVQLGKNIGNCAILVADE
jgi:NADPH-dependent curcumin reductase CurA